MSHFKPTSLLDRFYEVGLAIKAIDGFFETISGVLVLLIPRSVIRSITHSLTSSTLAKNPNSFWATYVAKTGANLAKGHNLFLASFFLINGIVKLAIVICLYLNQLWVYPIALIVLNLLLIYEIIQTIIKGSIGLGLLAVVDVVIIWLIYREWQKTWSTPNNKIAAEDV